jgi:hypoxanthine phosphoribosyltransferase
MEMMHLSTFISEKEIANRIKQLGQELTECYLNVKEDVIALCVLRGSFVFYSDLIREIDRDLKCEFLGLSSYGGKSSTGEVKMTLDIASELKNKHVLIIEDIVDTGLTMNYIQKMLELRQPASIKTVTFLHKPEAKKIDCAVDFVGFEIPNDFVVGYGLDYNGHYRNLPYLAQIQEFN